MLETNFANKCARDNNLYTKEYTIYLDTQVKSKSKSILKRMKKKKITNSCKGQLFIDNMVSTTTSHIQ